MWVAVILLVLADIVINALAKRDVIGSNFAGLLCGVAAGLLTAIAINDASTGAGVYAYYVNGVRVSSGGVAFFEGFALFVIAGAAYNLVAMGIGALFKRSAPAKRPRKRSGVFGLVMSIISLSCGGSYGTFGLFLLLQHLIENRPTYVTSDVAVLAVSLVLTGMGIFGIAAYVKKKKRAAAQAVGLAAEK